MQINKSFVGLGATMNVKNLMIAALAVVMLVAVTAAFATTGSVFAYEKSQADAQLNYCSSNGVAPLPENVWCQNSVSQIQGDGNEVETASGQGDIRRGSGGDGPDR
jgi:hypothetical protein